ncbi:hydantoinase/oxoprolinase family protein [Achromobacter aloeverae]
MSAWAIGIDIGGTFTDVVALNYEGGGLRTLKVLTTHGDPAQGVADGVKTLVGQCGIAAADVRRIVHATTLFTNALIERRGEPTGLLTTRGFRDVLEIGNERKYDLYDLHIEAAPALVQRRWRAEIGARMDAGGQELAPVDADDVCRAVQPLVDEGVGSLAVCLLHAYVDPRHEAAVRDILARHFPALEVTLSSDVAPVIREFERMSTTCANAYIKPLANRYLTSLQDRLGKLGLPTDVLMMLSNGGLCHVDEARRTPIELLESGPAAGAISASHYSLRDSLSNLLAFDMGGTTAKLCLVENGNPSIAYGFEAARQKRFAEGSGLPIRITTVDLIEIGAGGGSIAHRDALGLLKVGPQSAGSEPGPACYGRGGEDATVTDANLVLGYLNPDYFAGGTMAIDLERARHELARVGDSVGRDAVGAAWGIHDIVAENMAGAARVHVAERGRDPRDFVLLCTGGGGPLHGYYVAQKIGVRTLVCPPAAGVASAYGLLVAPARADRSRTVSMRPGSDSLRVLENAYTELESQVLQSLQALEATFGPVRLSRYADGRFVGQGFTLTVPLPPGPYCEGGHDDGSAGEDDAQDTRKALLAAFEDAYREKFGRTPPDVPIELLNLRVSGEAPPRETPRDEGVAAGAVAAPKARRLVYFRERGDYVDTPIFDRASLRAGFRADGPLLVEDEGSTLVVGPRGRVTQSATGNLIVEILEQA